MQEKIIERQAPLEHHGDRSLTPENAPEISIESTAERMSPVAAEVSERRAPHSSQNTTPTSAPSTVDPDILGIEGILASGLDGFFGHLSPDQQQRFKTDGESTAVKIREALHKQGTKIKDIVRLIINWLKGLPGINTFFLEQEAKIKADAIVRRYRS